MTVKDPAPPVAPQPLTAAETPREAYLERRCEAYARLLGAVQGKADCALVYLETQSLDQARRKLEELAALRCPE